MVKPDCDLMVCTRSSQPLARAIARYDRGSGGFPSLGAVTNGDADLSLLPTWPSGAPAVR